MNTAKMKNVEITDRCGKCRLNFPSRNDYHQHLVSSEKHIVCKKCHEEFLTPQGLKEHHRQNHPDEQDITCKCGQRFTRAAGLVAHVSEGYCPGAKTELDVGRIEGMLKKATLASPENPNLQNAIASTDLENQSDDDLLVFDPPRKNGLSSDNPWSTEKNYPNPYAAATPKDKGKGKTLDILTAQVGTSTSSAKKSFARIVAPSIPVLEPEVKPSPKSENVKPAVKSQVKPTEEVRMWTPAKPREATEWTKDKILDEIERQRNAVEEQNKKNPLHPSCPEFNASKYWNGILKVYRCPYPNCGKTKPNRETFTQHLRSSAHQDDKITCVVCLRVYSSPTAYVQHFESQGKRCRAREAGDGILSMVTGGVIRVVGENEDRTNKYGAWVEDQSAASPATNAIFNNLKEQQVTKNRQEAIAKYWEENPQW